MESWKKLHNFFIEVTDLKGETRHLSEPSLSAKVCGVRYKKILS